MVDSVVAVGFAECVVRKNQLATLVIVCPQSVVGLSLLGLVGDVLVRSICQNGSSQGCWLLAEEWHRATERCSHRTPALQTYSPAAASIRTRLLLASHVQVQGPRVRGATLAVLLASIV